MVRSGMSEETMVSCSESICASRTQEIADALVGELKLSGWVTPNDREAPNAV